MTRQVGGAEEPVPDAEAEPEVAVDGAALGVGVMPDVHLGRIHDVFQPADAPAQVGMGKVTDGGVEHADGESHLAGDAQKQGWGVEERVVDGNFHPVETPVADPIHFHDGVVDLVELPEDRNTVEEHVNAPFEEVDEEEQGKELEPPWPMGNGTRGEVAVEGGDPERGDVAQQNAGILAVEDKVDDVGEEAAGEEAVTRNPGPEALQGDEEQGQYGQHFVIRELQGLITNGTRDERQRGEDGREAAEAPLGVSFQITPGWRAEPVTASPLAGSHQRLVAACR